MANNFSQGVYAVKDGRVHDVTNVVMHLVMYVLCAFHWETTNTIQASSPRKQVFVQCI